MRRRAAPIDTARGAARTSSDDQDGDERPHGRGVHPRHGPRVDGEPVADLVVARVRSGARDDDAERQDDGARAPPGHGRAPRSCSSTSGTAGPSPSRRRTSSQAETATSVIEISRCDADDRRVEVDQHGDAADDRLERARRRAATRPSRRYAAAGVRSSPTSSATTTASTRSTPVSVRLPNSMSGWIVIASWNSGVNWPGSHCGHVEQPRPEPVSRTAPPVTTMPICATRLATTAGQRPAGRGAGRGATRRCDGRGLGARRPAYGPVRAARTARRAGSPGRRGSSQRPSGTPALSASGTAGSRPSRARPSSRRARGPDQPAARRAISARASPRRARRTAAARRRAPAGPGSWLAGTTTPPRDRQDEQQQVRQRPARPRRAGSRRPAARAR